MDNNTYCATTVNLWTLNQPQALCNTLVILVIGNQTKIPYKRMIYNILHSTRIGTSFDAIPNYVMAIEGIT